MKNLLFLGCFIALIFSLSPDASAQVKINFKKKINRELNRRANEKTDKGIKKGFDELEKGIKESLTQEDSAALKQSQGADLATGKAAGNKRSAGAGGEPETTDALTLNWSKFDFVPGDKVIFEDNQVYEENGEFPSRWDLVQGAVENAEFGGDNVIMFRGGSPTIVPYLKNSNTDYLPEVFTLEFDLFLPTNVFKVQFYDRKNQQLPRGSTYLDIWTTYMSMSPARSNLPGDESIAKKWTRISIAYTSGKLKAYVNDTRLINIPHLSFDPTGISFHVYHANDNNRSYIKNIRIAEGGVKYYDRFLQDGKIIANGIRFDVNKATLKPESMGIINEIVSLMKEHPEVNFSVEGHTDSDGDDSLNQSLSEQRAATVVSTMTKLGIDGNRLTSKGWGESKPMDTNDTPEGKANNRRVEFVRK